LASATSHCASSKRRVTPVDDLRRRIEAGDDLQILDVRRRAEYADGHVPRAVPAPLAGLQGDAPEALDPSRPLAVICAGGYRSSAATSLLTPRGFKEIFNVAGGTSAYVCAGYAVEK
jgi:hydroxyacylglutathione hydrolase